MELASKGIGPYQWNTSLQSKQELLAVKMFRRRLTCNFGTRASGSAASTRNAGSTRQGQRLERIWNFDSPTNPPCGIPGLAAETTVTERWRSISQAIHGSSGR